jgi:hypothetical protein
MSDFVALQTWGPRLSVDAFRSGVEAALGRQGLRLLDEESTKQLKYGLDEHRSFSVSLHDQGSSSQIWVFVPAGVFQAMGQGLIGGVFAGVSEAAMPWLGRSFDEFGHGVLTETELGGRLEFVDWFQYLSLDLVQGWGMDTLRAAFARVNLLPSGACCLWLEGSPMEQLTGRSHAAQTLGVTLRPAIARNPKTGKPVVVPWT